MLRWAEGREREREREVEKEREEIERDTITESPEKVIGHNCIVVQHTSVVKSGNCVGAMNIYNET